jgi:four helix bundle protein
MAKTVEGLEVWTRATEFWKGVDAVLRGRTFQRELRDQIRDSIDSILSNISEGFEQPTDRAFARYLFTAKASTAEARKRLWMAAERKFITVEEYQRLNALGDEVARMTVGLIKYLLRSNRRDRGLGSPD